MRVSVLLPIRWQVAIGRPAGRALSLLIPDKRRITERNIEVCFPEFSPGERQTLWQLFDLVKDPREENNVADQFPKVVEQMAENHAAWKSTLVPIWKKSGKDYMNPGPVTPVGYGWVISDGRMVPEKVEK